MKKLLLIDNYDSFTYNLVQYFQELGVEVVVKRNDEITREEAKILNPDYLVISPGPGTVENPTDIGVGPDLYRHFKGKIPILGVCLGQQMMGYLEGGKIVKIEPQHGKRWEMKKIGDSQLFKNIDETFTAMRYHSMIVSKEDFPSESLTITAEAADKGCIMAFENTDQKVFGVQFHPESIGTKEGMTILQNFLNA